MTPRMSVLPSRPFAKKASGAFQPAAVRAVMSPVSSVEMSEPSVADRNSVTGAVSTPVAEATAPASLA